ncbi:MAG: hypothetical protein ACXWP5_06980 [Bdellovibrionota bacterium]
MVGLRKFSKGYSTIPVGQYDIYTGGGKATPAEVPEWLPEPGDRSLMDYWQRIRKRPGTEDFFLTVYPFQKFAPPELLMNCRKFLFQMDLLGRTPGPVNAELFIGNYKKTPIGVHRDRCDIFCFLIRGEKSIRTWPAEAISAPAYSKMMDYEDRLPASTLFRGKAGDVIFWPASYWHIGEGSGDFHISISLSIDRGDSKSLNSVKRS